MKLFAASLSDKNFHLDRPRLFTVFATSDVIQMQKLFSSNVLLWGHASVWILQLKQQLNKEVQCVLLQKSIPSPFICTAEKFVTIYLLHF